MELHHACELYNRFNVLYRVQGYCFMISLWRHLRDGYYESKGKQRAGGDAYNLFLGTKLLRETMRKKLLMILGN